MSAEARAVAMVCTAEILSLAGFSPVPALLPQFMTIWSLSNAQGGWLAGIMSGGYMLAVLPLVVLTDRVPAWSVFLASSAVGALSCFGIALSNTFLAAVAWRAVSGAAIAGIYMPGLPAMGWQGRGALARRPGTLARLPLAHRCRSCLAKWALAGVGPVRSCWPACWARLASRPPDETNAVIDHATRFFYSIAKMRG